MIGTPSYNGDVSARYASSLAYTVLDLGAKGIPVIIKTAVHSSFIGRDEIISDFLKSECTHLLFIDSDQGWNPLVVSKMLDLNKECVAGAVPVDKDEYSLKIETDEDRFPLVFDGLLKAEWIGGAFMLLSRSGLNRVCNDSTHKKAVDRYSLFMPSYGFDGVFYGEDVSFCKIFKENGGEIFIYPNIDFWHKGIEGNYHNFLLNCSKE